MVTAKKLDFRMLLGQTRRSQQFMLMIDAVAFALVALALGLLPLAIGDVRQSPNEYPATMASESF
jgi:hypothetical protein